MIEKIFIAYANNSLSENPANLIKIYQMVGNHVSIPDDIKTISTKSIQLIIKFAEFENFSDANSHKDQLIAQKTKFSSFPIRTMGQTTVSKLRGFAIESTFSYVFGYKEGYCRHLCPNFGGVQKIRALGEKQIVGPPHLKCFECDQQYVRYVLNEIVKGKEFSQIIGFPQFVGSGRMLFRSGLSIRETTPRVPYKEIITEETIYDPTSQIFSFGMFIGCAVSYSVGNFLIKLDRKKNPLFLRLKICQGCNKFFIRSKNDNRINNCSDCSGKSTLSQGQKKQYMREYRKKRRREKLAFMREARIQNTMKRAECSREEAIKFVEADEEIEAEKTA